MKSGTTSSSVALRQNLLYSNSIFSQGFRVGCFPSLQVFHRIYREVWCEFKISKVVCDRRPFDRVRGSSVGTASILVQNLVRDQMTYPRGRIVKGTYSPHSCSQRGMVHYLHASVIATVVQGTMRNQNTWGLFGFVFSAACCSYSSL